VVDNDIKERYLEINIGMGEVYLLNFNIKERRISQRKLGEVEIRKSSSVSFECANECCATAEKRAAIS
jgi:hypothetical protein